MRSFIVETLNYKTLERGDPKQTILKTKLKSAAGSLFSFMTKLFFCNKVYSSHNYDNIGFFFMVFHFLIKRLQPAVLYK